MKIKKKPFICLIVLSALSMPNDAFAKQRTVSSACDMAANFIKKENGINLKSVKSVKSDLKLAYTAVTEKNDENTLYVFNRGTENGYVIVCADDCVDDGIIGFSDNGNFNPETIPDNLRSWLKGYSLQIEYMMAHKNAVVTAPKDIKYDTSVAPLLGETSWSQKSPYNLLTPKVNNRQTPAGCSAISMAQIMYYHRWPDTGVGSHFYKMSGQTLSADFGATTYQWDLMQPSYDDNSSEESKNAVATLAYHCGISIDSNYGAYTTSAFAEYQAIALATYFKYDKSSSFLFRDFYSYEEWTNILKKELDEGRPILYGGRNSSEGHSFVCDGYNNDGFFHFNWGWGEGDGYFKTTIYKYYSSDDPDQWSNNGFNIKQTITIGIQKDKGTADYSPSEIGLWLAPQCDKSSYRKNKTITLTLTEYSICNIGVMPYELPLYYTLYDENDNVVASYEVEIDNIFVHDVNVEDIATDITIGDDIADGDYTLYLTYKVPGKAGYFKAKPAYNHNFYQNVAVRGENVTITPASKILNGLSCDKITTTEVHSNYSCNFSCTVTNNGSEYYGPVLLALLDKESNEVAEMLYTFEGLDILPGESVTLPKSITIKSNQGDYRFALADDNGNVFYTTPVTVLAEPTNFDLHLKSTPNVISTDKNDIQVEVELNNLGDYSYNYYFGTFYNSNEEDYSKILKTNFGQIECKSNAVTKFVYSYSNPELVTGSDVYFIFEDNSLIIDEGVENHVTFKVSDASGIEDVNQDDLSVCVNHESRSIMVTSPETIQGYGIYSISGLLQLSKDNVGVKNVDIDTSALISGIYVLKINEADKIITRKVIVK